jgi:hypothetical protein
VILSAAVGLRRHDGAGRSPSAECNNTIAFLRSSPTSSTRHPCASLSPFQALQTIYQHRRRFDVDVFPTPAAGSPCASGRDDRRALSLPVRRHGAGALDEAERSRASRGSGRGQARILSLRPWARERHVGESPPRWGGPPGVSNAARFRQGLRELERVPFDRQPTGLRCLQRAARRAKSARDVHLSVFGSRDVRRGCAKRPPVCARSIVGLDSSRWRRHRRRPGDVAEPEPHAQSRNVR